MSSRVSTFTSPGSATNQSVTGLPFQPGSLLLATTYISNTGSSVNDAHLGFGVGVSSTERASASTYARNGRPTMQTASALVSNRPMTALDNSDAAVSQFDLVSMNSDGFTVSWAVSDAYITPYLALGNNVITKVGHFDLTTGAGTQDITTGVDPKLVILFTATPNATEGGHAGAYFSYGVADADGGVYSMTAFDGDAGATSSSWRYSSITHAFSQTDASSVIAQISTVTMLDGGFRIAKSTPPAANLRIGYVAIGGLNFAAKVTSIDGPLNARTVSYTRIGFRPDSFIFIDPGMINGSVETRVFNSHIGIGFADALANNAAVSCVSKGLNAQSLTKRRLSLTDCILTLNLLSSGFSGVRARANLISADSDGFTLDWPVTDGAQRTYGVVAISTEAPIEPGQLVLEGASDISFQVAGSVTITLDVETGLSLASGEDLSFTISTETTPAGLILEGANDIEFTLIRRGGGPGRSDGGLWDNFRPRRIVMPDGQIVTAKSEADMRRIIGDILSERDAMPIEDIVEAIEPKRRKRPRPPKVKAVPTPMSSEFWDWMNRSQNDLVKSSEVRSAWENSLFPVWARKTQ